MPFFPFGFYHVSWAERGTSQQRQEDVRKIGGGGFNLMVTEPINDQDAAGYGAFLDTAQRSGVYVMTYGLSPAAAKTVEHYPAVLGFQLADDSNVLVTPAEIRQRHQAIKAVAPSKLTYISLAVGYDRPERQYFGVSDMVGNQSYPIGRDDISVTYPVMQSAVQSALARNTVPLANLQTFGWRRGQAPNEVELRNMTYQALMAGVKGIVYYAYRSREVDLNHEPRLWNTARQLAREVAVLSPALLGGERVELADGTGTRPLVVRFRGPGGDYLLALNNSRTDRREVQLQLPDAPRRLCSLSGPRKTLRLQGDRLTGRLAPLEVVTYRLEETRSTLPVFDFLLRFLSRC
ncbi:carbohydrate-binding CenC domain-containing protein [Deinococcus phoenicis]|uniref:Carbohydrate-binding CenC domain-containing protein n=1 Tax=Deinococcus phoenicis TaxID=1476583 RepID=A0A016QTP1_9DEIO|nr:carbohydrate-binding CenC domain-containing protein [Deinococcus phoenicis]